MTLLILLPRLPKNLKFRYVKGSDGSERYLGDIIHQVELGQLVDDLGPMVNKSTCSGLFTNIVSADFKSNPSPQRLTKSSLRNFVCFSYYLFRLIHSEIKDFEAKLSALPAKEKQIWKAFKRWLKYYLVFVKI